MKQNKTKKVVTWAKHENPSKLSPMECSGTGHCQAEAPALRYAQWLEEAQAEKKKKKACISLNIPSPPFLLKYKES